MCVSTPRLMITYHNNAAAYIITIITIIACMHEIHQNTSYSLYCYAIQYGHVGRAEEHTHYNIQ